AFNIAAHASPSLSSQLVNAVNASFMHVLHVGCLVADGVCWLGALGALALPGRPARAADHVSVHDTNTAPSLVG
ncbi:MAG: drug resistance transporter, EmrB/QacA subfamily, partial [Pseudonocardiales bacterium]|nr:drug resistance transporter, EmrB/QacA subfamily [Pseudonocardiales bacterium]